MMTKKNYDIIAEFLGKLKVIHGPEFVNATLNRHKDLYKALLEYEKSAITELESNLSAKE